MWCISTSPYGVSVILAPQAYERISLKSSATRPLTIAFRLIPVDNLIGYRYLFRPVPFRWTVPLHMSSADAAKLQMTRSKFVFKQCHQKGLHWSIAFQKGYEESLDKASSDQLRSDQIKKLEQVLINVNMQLSTFGKTLMVWIRIRMD
jgi:hypothetical protein